MTLGLLGLLAAIATTPPAGTPGSSRLNHEQEMTWYATRTRVETQSDYWRQDSVREALTWRPPMHWSPYHVRRMPEDVLMLRRGDRLYTLSEMDLACDSRRLQCLSLRAIDS